MALAPKVDSTTAVTKWRGEDCDYGMVVEGLLGRDGVPRDIIPKHLS